MHESLRRAALASGLALLLPTSAAAADFLPVLQEGYNAEPTLSVISGSQNPDLKGQDSGSVTGAEFSLACPLLEVQGPGIRQQLSLAQYDEGGLTMSHVEINPHYLVSLSPNAALGFGPGLGYINAEVDGGSSDGVLGIQAGVSLHYRRGPLFLGAEYRYQWTTEADLGPGSDEALDNQRAVAKVGINF